MIHLYVGDDVTAYDFYIRRRLNFIRGDSGTGKTSFVDLLNMKLSQGNPEIELKYEGISGFMVAILATLEPLIKDEKNIGKLVVLDEAFQMLESGFAGLISEYCLKMDLYFLIIMRQHLVFDSGISCCERVLLCEDCIYKYVSEGN